MEIAGIRYSHIVNPLTGIGLTNRVAVTIIAKDGITSDSLTKVVSVLGLEKSQNILKHFDVRKVYVKYPQINQ